jgi:hypothetical protein
MNTQRLPSAGIVTWSFRFWVNHFGLISFCMLFAALGRAIQMRVFGPIPSPAFIGLEIVVELARIVTVLVIIGHGNLRRGIGNAASIFRFKREQWRGVGISARATVRQHWPVLLWNLLVFSLIAFVFNWINGLIADKSGALIFLKNSGFIQTSATGMPLVFFLKNLTVIPFTLVFDYGLVRWLSGKFPLTSLRFQAAS